jgi:uncharacterized protein
LNVSNYLIPARGLKHLSSFTELWTSLQDNDRDFLRRLIADEIPTQEDKGVMKKLTRKEILTSDGNTFQVPLVQRFIEQLLEQE